MNLKEVPLRPRPIENCYWVVPGKLLAGEYPRTLDDESSRAKLKALTDAGIVSFIDLTKEGESGLRPYSQWLEAAERQRFPIKDLSVPNSPELTTEILDAIDDNIQNDRPTYVHCWGGVGRTGMIIGCWLTRHGYEGKSALERLNELWSHNPKSSRRNSPETYEQEQYILDWNKE